MLIERIGAEAYTVPTDGPEADGTLAWNDTTVVVVEVAAGEEVGLGWTYGPACCVDVVDDLLAPVVVEREPAEGPAIYEDMVRASRNATRPGLVSLALSAVDNAIWDLRARVLGVPLVDLLGRARDSVPVYGSGGFTTYDEERLRAQVAGWLAAGMTSVKIKIGESWGTKVARDLDRVRQVRRFVEGASEIFVDANGAYQRKQALRIGRELQDLGVTWFEEPVSSDDAEGLRLLRERLDLDVAAGEYAYDADYVRRLLEQGAVDCLQIDVTRCGGITGWRRSAALAQAHHLEVSGHCAPLQHLAVAMSIPNLRHLEYFHDHQRIEGLMFPGASEVVGGRLQPVAGPGNGLAFDRSGMRDYRVR